MCKSASIPGTAATFPKLGKLVLLCEHCNWVWLYLMTPVGLHHSHFLLPVTAIFFFLGHRLPTNCLRFGPCSSDLPLGFGTGWFLAGLSSSCPGCSTVGLVWWCWALAFWVCVPDLPPASYQNVIIHRPLLCSLPQLLIIYSVRPVDL